MIRCYGERRRKHRLLVSTLKSFSKVLFPTATRTTAQPFARVGESDARVSWPPNEADLKAFDFERNEIVTAAIGSDPIDSDPNGSDPIDSDPIGSNPIGSDRNTAEADQNRSDHVERSLPVDTGRIRWLVPVLIAVTFVETIYLGVDVVVREKRLPEVASARTTALEAVPLPAQAVVVLAAGPRAAPGAAGVDETSSNAHDVGPVEIQSRRIAPSTPRTTPQAVDPEPVKPPGGVSIALPIQVQIFERGRFVGTNDSERVPLAVGRHELELVNESLRYRSTVVVEVTSGKVAAIAATLPSGTLHLNALPWSDVLIDGEPAGQTPLGNVQVPIGPHQIVFRHPQLGDQTRTAVVAVGAATRVTVDLRK